MNTVKIETLIADIISIFNLCDTECLVNYESVLNTLKQISKVDDEMMLRLELISQVINTPFGMLNEGMEDKC